MQGAPHNLRTLRIFAPDDPAFQLQEGFVAHGTDIGRATGLLSTIRAAAIPAASRHLLTLTLAPLDAAAGGDPEPLAIGIMVNGREISQVRLDPKWQGEGADLAFWLPPELVGGSPFELAFRHTRDFRLVALKLAQGGRVLSTAAMPDPAELMLRFENIGDNCEFGLVQRHFKADPVGLLRFAGLRTPRRLIRFLDDEFGEFGKPGSLGVTVIGGEYWIVDKVYGMAYHTFRYQNDVAAELVIQENETKAAYLIRKFREDLEDGEKILVYKRVVTQDLHEIIALHAALNRLGTINKLLWVTQADDRHTPGDVEWVGDRLLKGYTRSISLTNAHDYDAEIWLRLCRNAAAAFDAAEPDRTG